MAIHQKNNSKPGDMSTAQDSAKQYQAAQKQGCSEWALALRHVVLTQFVPGRVRESPEWHLSFMSSVKMETL